MPTPDVVIGEKSRAGMLRGFNSMARLLAITLGPTGGKIAYDKHSGMAPELLTDAATIARRIIQISNRLEDCGAMMMRHLVWQMREEVGDGTATTAVLAQAIANEFHKMVAAGANAMMLKRGIERATAVAARTLEEMSLPLEGEEQIAAVATAAIGDPQIGKLLGEMYDVLGPHANIICTAYVSTKHDRSYHEGARFQGRYVSPYLLNDRGRRVSALENPYIFVSDLEFEGTASVQSILERVINAGGKSVLIFCKKMSDKAIGVLVANNEKGTILSSAATLTVPMNKLEGTLDDIGLLVGATPVKGIPGVPVDVRMENFGRADRALVGLQDITIVGGKGDKVQIRDRVKRLRESLRTVKNTADRNDLRTSLMHFSSGIGELHIGALTNDDRVALKEMAEQAMKAVMSGVENGVVPGGGAAYLACIPAVLATPAEGDEAIGVQILARALEEPLRCIVTNAGIHPPLVIDEVMRQGRGYGYDVKKKCVVNMFEAGIVDSTMVVERALQYATSGALMLLTTDALVLHRKPKEATLP